ncbi:MAG TPA: hypothetical protein VG898_03245 [Solirubrobacterales bacterium]|nr:hypothetical protein [Solirubrobacterales bacterium]
MRPSAIAVPLALALLLIASGPATASFEPIRLVSKSSLEQADEAVSPALSADGRYLAFRGSIDGLKGIFRKDLSTGAVEEVVAASAYLSDPRANSEAPSISATGRYISFTTRARLDPAEDQAANSGDVYVADMSSSPPTYTLASALDGSATGLAYASDEGSSASGRVALSADGRRVALVTLSASNLLGASGGTPAGQVLLRDLDSQRTILVSAVRDAASGQMTVPAQPVAGGAAQATGTPRPRPGAALSADGTTVAWLGTHLSAQVPVLADEPEAVASQPYTEPLWRRVADGPAAPTRRVVGGGDPLAPGCPPDGTLADPSCRGPFPMLAQLIGDCASAAGWLNSNLTVNGTPQLSADGRTVAMIGEPNGFSNVFVVDMRDGLSRRQALRPLTREVPIFDPCSGVTDAINVPNVGLIFDIAISPNGRRIAFATARQQFPLAPPSLIGAAPPSLGLTELYRIDLDGETLERVTHEVGGVGPSDRGGGEAGGQGSSSPSFNGTGGTLAFASLASNLAGGDTNGASDAFVVSESASSGGPGEVSISAPPPSPRARLCRRFVVSAFSEDDGSVRVAALVPGAGVLRARAKAALGGHRHKRVAAARRRAGREGLLVLKLKPARRMRKLAHRRGGLLATLRVDFTQARRKPLRRKLEVRFHAGSASASGTKRKGKGVARCAGQRRSS